MILTKKLKNLELKEKLLDSVLNLRMIQDIDADIKTSFYDISEGIGANIRGNKPGWAASIIKVPIMVSVLEEIEKKNLSLGTMLGIDHRFTLEPLDYVSTLPQGHSLPVADLIYHMITASDNEATNMLVNRIGIPTINISMLGLGLENTMFGHLLCPDVPRYFTYFNPDGSNLTCPNDMVNIMRHIYDPSFSKLNEKIRKVADFFLSKTYPTYLGRESFSKNRIKSKIGIISSIEKGDDVHEVGVIDDNLIVCIMLNKIDQKRLNGKGMLHHLFDSYLMKDLSLYDTDCFDTESNKVYRRDGVGLCFGEVMRTIEKYKTS